MLICPLSIHLFCLSNTASCGEGVSLVDLNRPMSFALNPCLRTIWVKALCACKEVVTSSAPPCEQIAPLLRVSRLRHRHTRTRGLPRPRHTEGMGWDTRRRIFAEQLEGLLHPLSVESGKLGLHDHRDGASFPWRLAGMASLETSEAMGLQHKQATLHATLLMDGWQRRMSPVNSDRVTLVIAASAAPCICDSPKRSASRTIARVKQVG